MTPSSRSGDAGAESALVVTLRTHGGLAAGVALARAPRVVDTRRLSPGEAAQLRDLLAAAAPGPAAAAPGPTAAPGSGTPADVSRYTVTVEPVPPAGAAAGAPVVLAATDLDLNDAFADLVDWIEEHTARP